MSDLISSWLEIGEDSASGGQDGWRLRMPAEWEPMEAVWLSWPQQSHLWGDVREQAMVEYAGLVEVLGRFAPVRINCASVGQGEAWAVLKRHEVVFPENQFYDIETDDVWCRDHGATFVIEENARRLHAVKWVYNGWGEKFPHARDAKVAEAMALSSFAPQLASQLVCEGGALEINGAGVLLTTESVLLNHNRNPDWSRKQVEEELQRVLGVSEVVWLRDGLSGDDTDGHIDMLARFFKDDGIVTIRRKDSRAPDYHVLEENYERLSSLRTPSGGRYDIACLPLPDPLQLADWRYEQVPVSYANFLILNEGLVVPVYDLGKDDRNALGLLGELFPEHEVSAVQARHLIQEGGAVHCLTQQVPRV